MVCVPKDEDEETTLCIRLLHYFKQLVGRENVERVDTGHRLTSEQRRDEQNTKLVSAHRPVDS